MEINGYFLFQETIMKCEHISNGAEWGWVNENVLLQKGLEVFIRLIFLIVIFKFDDVIILLSVPQFVTELIDIPFGVN
jgi:hypothetical protein